MPALSNQLPTDLFDAPAEVVDRVTAQLTAARQLRRLKWSAIFFVGFLHAGALWALWHFSWRGFWTFAALQWLTGAVGICLGYHRFLTHQSFKAPRFVAYLLTTLGCLANQGGPIAWVATHRVHHAYSDQPDDPHSPKEGFWWAHMGWALCDNALLDDFNVYRRFAQDLAKDPYYRFLDRTHWLWSWLLAVPLYLWGGFSTLLWGVFFRSVFVYHGTWLVNSAAHIWGYRTYETGEGSRNLWWVALISYGEGWHNNHHAFQRSARHGMRWWELDATYLTIRVMSWLQLASDLQLPTGAPAVLQPRPRLILPTT